MKKLEFETSKGKFVLVDLPSYEEIEKELQIFGYDQGLTNEDLNNYFRHILPDFNISYKLSEITEEQASQIVDEYRRGYKNYTWRNPKLGGQQVAMVISDYHRKAIDSLSSLFDSKGIYLYENPHPRRYIMAMTDKGIIDTTDKLYLEAEEKTFYNPFIFKL